MARDHSHAIPVANDDVTWIHRNTAATDRNIALHGVMLREVQRRAGAGTEHRELCHVADRSRIADAAITDQAGDAAHHQTHRKDLARESGACVAAAVDHQHMCFRRDLDCLALRVLRIGEHAHIIDILARGDVAQGESRPNQIARISAEWPHALHECIAQAALEQLRGQGCGADQAKSVDRLAGQAGHRVSTAASRPSRTATPCRSRPRRSMALVAARASKEP
jgi:hypothetical protein